MSAYPIVSLLLLSFLALADPFLFSLFSKLPPLCLYLLSGTAGGLSSSEFTGGGGGRPLRIGAGEFCGEPHGEAWGEECGETLGDANGELLGEFLGEFHGELNGDDLDELLGEPNGDARVTTRVGEVGD